MMILPVIIILSICVCILSALTYKFFIILKADNSLLSNLIDRLPIGLLVLDTSYNILLINRWLKQTHANYATKDIKDYLQLPLLIDMINAKQQSSHLITNPITFKLHYFSHHRRHKTWHFFVFLSHGLNQKEKQSKVPEIEFNAVSLMARGLAHELKNPMTSIKLLLDMSPTEKPIDQQEFRSILHFEFERLDKIIGDFHHYATTEKLDLSIENVSDIIKTVEEIIDQSYEPGSFKITKDLHPLPKLKIDRKKMIQILLNLIVNSIEALPEYGGTIEIVTRKTPSEISIEIVDDGKGIPIDKQPHICLPFYSSKPNGIGLGLAYTYKIVKSHGGLLTFHSDPGTKTRFKISLPTNTPVLKTMLKS